MIYIVKYRESIVQCHKFLCIQQGVLAPCAPPIKWLKSPHNPDILAIELNLAVWQLPPPRLNNRGTAKAFPVGFSPAIG